MNNRLCFLIALISIIFCADIFSETERYTVIEKTETYKNTECKISIKYPNLNTIKKEASIDIQNALNNKILSSIGSMEKQSKSLDTVSEDFYKAFLANAKDMEDLGYRPQPFELIVEATSVEGIKGLLVVRILVMEYTGGAHPNTFVSFWNYDLAKQKELQIFDIVKKEKLKELEAIAESYFKKLKEIKVGESYTEAGYFWDTNKFQLPENFGFGINGLIFHYNQYEIASYAIGQTEFTIPWEVLENLTAVSEYF